MGTQELERISIVGKSLASKLRIIALLLFVFPCTVIAYLIHEGGLLPRIDASILFILFLILVLAFSGLSVLRQAFEKFVMVSVFMKKAESGEPVMMDTRQDTAELGEISLSFNRLVSRLEETTREMESLRADLRDTTLECRRAEESLVALKKAVDIMQLGVTITDVNRRILYTNAAEARIHGYEVEELIGRDARIFAPPEYHRDRGFEDMQRMTSWSREGINVRKDGRLFPVRFYYMQYSTDSHSCVDYPNLSMKTLK